MSTKSLGPVLIALALVAIAVRAQHADGGFEPKVVNPGDSDATLIRELPELKDAGAPSTRPNPRRRPTSRRPRERR